MVVPPLDSAAVSRGPQAPGTSTAGLTLVSVRPEGVTDRTVLSDMRGRITWGVAAIALTVALIGAIPAVVYLTWVSLPRERRLRRRFLNLWALLVLATAGAAAAFLGSGFDFGGQLGESLLSHLEARPGLSVRAMTDTMNVLAAVIVTLLATAFAAVLCSVHAAGDASGAVAALGVAIDRARRLLLIGAVLLVLAVLEVSALFEWSAALFPVQRDGTGHLQVVSIVRALTFADGCVLSMVLIAMYLPTSFLLGLRVRQLEERHNRGEDGSTVSPADKWRKDRGLDTSSMSALWRLLAALAPLVAGGPGIDLIRWIESAA